MRSTGNREQPLGANGRMIVFCEEFPPPSYDEVLVQMRMERGPAGACPPPSYEEALEMGPMSTVGVDCLRQLSTEHSMEGSTDDGLSNASDETMSADDLYLDNIPASSPAYRNRVRENEGCARKFIIVVVVAVLGLFILNKIWNVLNNE